MIMSLVFLFLFYLLLFIVQALTVFVQKYTKKNSLNNKPIRTITEHPIEMTNHKVQCSKHTLWSLTRRHTLVASKLCIWSCFVITAVIIIIFLILFSFLFFCQVGQWPVYCPPPLCFQLWGQAQFCCTWQHTDVSRLLAVRLQLFGKKVGPYELFHANNQAVFCDSSHFNLHVRC